jgi:hypothetical protein
MNTFFASVASFCQLLGHLLDLTTEPFPLVSRFLSVAVFSLYPMHGGSFL